MKKYFFVKNKGLVAECGIDNETDVNKKYVELPDNFLSTHSLIIKDDVYAYKSNTILLPNPQEYFDYDEVNKVFKNVKIEPFSETAKEVMDNIYAPYVISCTDNKNLNINVKSGSYTSNMGCGDIIAVSSLILEISGKRNETSEFRIMSNNVVEFETKGGTEIVKTTTLTGSNYKYFMYLTNNGFNPNGFENVMLDPELKKELVDRLALVYKAINNITAMSTEPYYTQQHQQCLQNVNQPFNYQYGAPVDPRYGNAINQANLSMQQNPYISGRYVKGNQCC